MSKFDNATEVITDPAELDRCRMIVLYDPDNTSSSDLPSNNSVVRAVNARLLPTLADLNELLNAPADNTQAPAVSSVVLNEYIFESSDEGTRVGTITFANAFTSVSLSAGPFTTAKGDIDTDQTIGIYVDGTQTDQIYSIDITPTGPGGTGATFTQSIEVEELPTSIPLTGVSVNPSSIPPGATTRVYITPIGGNDDGGETITVASVANVSNSSLGWGNDPRAFFIDLTTTANVANSTILVTADNDATGTPVEAIITVSANDTISDLRTNGVNAYGGVAGGDGGTYSPIAGAIIFALWRDGIDGTSDGTETLTLVKDSDGSAVPTALFNSVDPDGNPGAQYSTSSNNWSYNLKANEVAAGAYRIRMTDVGGDYEEVVIDLVNTGFGAGGGGTAFTSMTIPTVAQAASTLKPLTGWQATGRPAYPSTAGGISVSASGLTSHLNSINGVGGVVVLTSAPTSRITVHQSGTLANPIKIMCATEHSLTIGGAGSIWVTGQHVELIGFRWANTTTEAIRFYDLPLFGNNTGGRYGKVLYNKFVNMPSGVNSVSLMANDLKFMYNNCTEIGTASTPFLYTDGPGFTDDQDTTPNQLVIPAPQRLEIAYNSAANGFTFFMAGPAVYYNGVNNTPFTDAQVGTLRDTGILFHHNHLYGTWQDQEMVAIKSDGFIWHSNWIEPATSGAHVSTRMGHDSVGYGNVIVLNNGTSDVATRVSGYNSKFFYNLIYSNGASIVHMQADCAGARTGPWYGRYGTLFGSFDKNIVVGACVMFRVLYDAYYVGNAEGYPILSDPRGNSKNNNLFLGATPDEVVINSSVPMTEASFAAANDLGTDYVLTDDGAGTTFSTASINPNFDETISFFNAIRQTISVDPASDLLWSGQVTTI